MTNDAKVCIVELENSEERECVDSNISCITNDQNHEKIKSFSDSN